MKTKEEALKILNKYGFYSSNRAPYIYANKDSIGIYFTFISKSFGTLNRVLFFDSLEDLEDAIYEYWWYQNNKNSLQIDVEFDDYETLSPNVSYIYEGCKITKEDMKNISSKKDILAGKEEEITSKQLARTSNILINIYKEKLSFYEKIKDDVETLKEELISLNKKCKKVSKLNEKEIENYDKMLEDNKAHQIVIDSLERESSVIIGTSRYKEFILKIMDILRNLDVKEYNLQNIYLVNKYSFEIEDLKLKMGVLDEAKEKKGLFKSKKDLTSKISLIDEKSKASKMININLFIDKERKSILSRYESYENISLEVLGDYIKEFEKLDIDLPSKIESLKTSEALNYKEVQSNLLVKFEKLSKKEKSACYVATSFLKPCLNVLYDLDLKDKLNVTVLINSLVNSKKLDMFSEAFRILENFVNTKIRVKYFSVLKLNDLKTFIFSLVGVMDILDTIDLKLDNNFYGYFKVMDEAIISVYLKNIYSIKKDTTYIGEFKPGSPIYYAPVSIVKEIDIMPNDELSIREHPSLFMLKEKVNILDEDKEIVVNYYQKDKCIMKNNAIIVGDTILDKTYKYQNYNITFKE